MACYGHEATIKPNALHVMQAPVTFSLVQQGPAKAGAEGICVKARNKQLFASTAGLLFTWRLLLDGAALPIGDMLQQSPNGWHPGGQVAIEPQVGPRVQA